LNVFTQSFRFSLKRCLFVIAKCALYYRNQRPAELYYIMFGDRLGGRLPRMESKMSHAIQKASGSVHREIREEGKTGEMPERSRLLANFEEI